MVVEYLKRARDWIVARTNFVLGPWMRNPEKSVPLFNALVGYALMLTTGRLSTSLLAKLLTWGVFLVWTVVRSVELTDVRNPMKAAKKKLPKLAHYHAGAAAGFLLTSL